MALVVNMHGGPGRGKSTSAYKLIGLLKHNDFKSELVTEYVKHSAYIGNKFEIEDQVFLLAQHNHRLKILNEQVDIIVSDGSLLNTIAYCNRSDQELERNMAKELYSRYVNIGFVVPRKAKYMKYGRMQTREEAEELDQKIFDIISYLPEKERINLQEYEWLQNNQEESSDIILKVMYNKVVEEAARLGIYPQR